MDPPYQSGIKNIQVYDPVPDGLAKSLDSLRKHGSAFAVDVRDEMFRRFLDFPIGNVTMSTFLFDPAKGYFVQNPEIVAVTFANGKLHREYNWERYNCSWKTDQKPHIMSIKHSERIQTALMRELMKIEPLLQSEGFFYRLARRSKQPEERTFRIDSPELEGILY
ncbi:hypothetical protein J4212_08340 [Candidatus Woesearchaeota archaeon]|nr:hypothetical protein [Candidatus Woesearchaeota archaeon]